MAKYDAVDQLMALATEKRADRIAPGAPAAQASAEPAEKTVLAPATKSASPKELGEQPAKSGRQWFDTIRPLLPAVAGAMRLVDHGAVQAMARLLPLLGGVGSSGAAGSAKAADEQEQFLSAFAEMQAAQRSTRKEIDALTLRLATTEDVLGRTRTQLERLQADQQTRETEFRSQAEHMRLLSAGLIILLMLIVAQMILLVIMLHK